MKISKFIFITTILFSFFGCKKKEKDKLQFEKDVINNVFIEIVDSIYMDRRTMLPPPMPRLDFKTNKEDTIGYHDKLKKYKIEQDSIKNDKAKILIGANDFIKKIRKQEKKLLIETFNDPDFVYDNSKENNFKFDLKPFKNNEKFNFQYSSKFPDHVFWDANDKKSLMPVGTIEISRIQFNKAKTSGILSASTSCGGGTCGQGFLIIIENKLGKWKIKKIIDTWIS